VEGEAVTRAGALRRLAREERGVAIAELALVLPVVLLILLGILDFGKALNYWIDQTHLANEGARWAVVNRNPSSTGTLQAYIKGQADTDQLRNGATVTIQACDADGSGAIGAGDPVQVTVAYDYNWLPLIGSAVGAATTTLTGKAVMRLEQKPTNFTLDSTACP
jgi:Flp pilus assembly protein TadG